MQFHSVSAESFLYTTDGLRKGAELKAGNEVLGIDLYNSISSWKKISSTLPRPAHMSEHIHVFSDQSEALVASQAEVSTIDEGRKIAANLNYGNLLEVFAESSAWDRMSSYKESLREEDAYLMGLITRATYISSNLVSLRIESDPRDLNQILRTFLMEVHTTDPKDDLACYSEKGPFSNLNWIIIRSENIARRVTRFRCSRTAVPFRLRNPLSPATKQYVGAMLDVGCVLTEDGLDFVTNIDQQEVRRFFFNILFRYEIRPIRVLVLPSWSPDTIIIRLTPNDIFSKFELRNDSLRNDKMNAAKRQPKAVVRYVVKKQQYAMTFAQPDLNWRPFSDLICVH
jgi:hypothetical protein